MMERRTESRKLGRSVLWTVAAIFVAFGGGAALAQMSTPSTGTGIGLAHQGAKSADSGKQDSGGSKLSVIPEDFSKLKLAPGFMVDVQVFDGPDFSGPYRMDDEGNISIPFAGTLNLSGRTVVEAQQLVANKLKSKELFTRPEVRVTVLEYSAPQVTILGEVASPGKYPLLNEKKFVEVLSMAGGLAPTAGSKVEIHRSEGTDRVLTLNYSRGSSASSVENVMIKPGDIIQVHRAGLVYVLGAVNRPGGYLMQEDGKLDVTQALALAYGTSLQAAMGKIHIIRRDANGALQQIPVHYKDNMKAKATPIMLRAEDVVYVPTSKLKAALIDSQSVMTSTATAAIYTVVR